MAVKIANRYGYPSEVSVEDADIVLDNRIDTSAMEIDFGWKAQYSLEESLNHIFCENMQKQ